MEAGPPSFGWAGSRRSIRIDRPPAPARTTARDGSPDPSVQEPASGRWIRDAFNCRAWLRRGLETG
jgi:hypothetical protein